MNKRVTAVIQARTTSERLPQKVLAPLADKIVLEHVYNAVKNCSLVDEVYVATTTNKEDDIIIEYAERYDVKYVRGDEKNVLSRFEEVSKNSDSDIFVRITADDPLLDPNVTDIVIANFLKGDFDYVSNMVERSWPRGMDTEVFSRESLDATLENADLDDHKEHVTIFIRTNPDKFNIKNVSSLAQERMPDLRLCIDTEEDYELLKIIFDNIYVKGEIIRIGEVLKFLRSNPQYLDINGSIEQRKIFGKVF